MLNKEVLLAGGEKDYIDVQVVNNVFQGTEKERTLHGLTFTSMYQRDDTNIYWTGTYTKGTITGFYVSGRGNQNPNHFYFNSGGWSDGRILDGKYSTLTGTVRISINEDHPDMD